MLTEGFHRCLTSLYNCLSWTTTVARALLNLYSKRGIYGYSAPIVDPKRVGTRDWGFLPKIHHRNRHHISNIRYMYVVIVMVCRRFPNVFCIFTTNSYKHCYSYFFYFFQEPLVTLPGKGFVSSCVAAMVLLHISVFACQAKPAKPLTPTVPEKTHAFLTQVAASFRIRTNGTFKHI